MGHNGGLAPDRCVEPKRDWLIRGPLFYAQRTILARTGDPTRFVASDNGLSPRCEKIALDKLFANRPHGGLRSIGHTNLSQDVLDVFFDGLVADSQRLGDLLVRQTE